MRLVLVAAVTAVLVGCSPTSGPTPTVTSTSVDGLQIPVGWREVVSGDVKLDVPPEFVDGNAVSQLTSWCEKQPTSTGVVGVGDGTTPLVGCLDGDLKGTDADDTGPVVAIVPTRPADGSSNPLLVDDGDRAIKRVGVYSVIVQAEAELRDTILSTVRTAD